MTFFQRTPQQRRFDSIAWLIQGDDVCGAAAFDGKQLLLATNKPDGSNLVFRVVNYLKYVAQTSYESLTNKTSYEVLKRRHQLKMNKLNNYANTHIELYKNNNDYKECFQRALNKITRSIRHSYCTEKHNDTLPNALLLAIRAGNMSFIAGSKGLHAELKIVEKLIEEKQLNPQTYIGVSKRCCLECENAIQAFNNVHKGTIGEDIFHTRDEGHRSHFPARIPSFLKNDLAVQKEFLKLYGENAVNDTTANLSEIEKIFHKPVQKSNLTQLLTNSDSPTQTSEKPPSIKF